jgi:hypothetical protein
LFSLKKEGNLSTCKNMEDIMLSEISQTAERHDLINVESKNVKIIVTEE